MYRYLLKNILRLLKIIITKWNYKLIILYIILVIFSTLTLVYQQSNSHITWHLLSESLINDNEIIQVNKKLNFVVFFSI